MNVLFVSGHPDDHITSAGLLNRFYKAGNSLYEVVMTGGSGGYTDLSERDKITEIRRQEFTKAQELLGIEKAYMLDYDEHELQMNRENVERLVRIIRRVKPTVIIIPNRDDYHETHIETNRIATKAIRTAMKNRKLELGKPVQPSLVFEWEFSVPKQPDAIIDISNEWEFKRLLLQCYGSQITSTEFQKLKSLNQYRGSMMGVSYAEAFKTNRFLPLRLEALEETLNQDYCKKKMAEFEKTYETELTEEILDEKILEDFFIEKGIIFKGQKVKLTIKVEEVE